MKNLGKRTIDDLGRIVLPKEVRQAKGWKKSDEIMFYDYNGVIVIEKSEQNNESGQILDSGNGQTIDFIQAICEQ